MKQATVITYKYDRTLNRSVPARVEVREETGTGSFTPEEVLAIFKAVLGIEKYCQNDNGGTPK